MDREDILKEFCNRNNIDVSQGRFFLESTNWNYELATALLHEVIPPEEGHGLQPSSDVSKVPEVTGSSSGISGGDQQPPQPLQRQQNTQGQGMKSGTASKKFATLRDLEGNDESAEEKSHLFTGGEKSGLSVEDGDPDPKKQLVRDILEKARQHTISPLDEQDSGPSSLASSWASVGQRLGTENEASGSTTPVTQSGPPRENPPTENQPEKPLRRTLYFWRNGFSVDDGPIYTYDDPANQEMLRYINSGRAPLHLLGVSMNQPIDVVVQHRMDEDYVAPFKPFSGKGQRLGSTYMQPRMSQMPGGLYTDTSTSSSVPINVKPNSTTPHASLQIDENKPTTRIQVRLSNGGRTVLTVNLSHTLHDIYEAVRAVSPGNFILSVPFPAKTLEDDPSVTVEAASLKNASLVQKSL